MFILAIYRFSDYPALRLARKAAINHPEWHASRWLKLCSVHFPSWCFASWKMFATSWRYDVTVMINPVWHIGFYCMIYYKKHINSIRCLRKFLIIRIKKYFLSLMDFFLHIEMLTTFSDNELFDSFMQWAASVAPPPPTGWWSFF